MRNLADFFDALYKLHLEVQTAAGGENKLRVYPGLKPDRLEGPAIYNSMDPSRSEALDTLVDRDTLFIGCRVALNHSDAAQQQAQLFELSDLYRSIVYPGLRDRDKPIWAARGRVTAWMPFRESINDVPFFGIEFVTRAQLDVPTFGV